MLGNAEVGKMYYKIEADLTEVKQSLSQLENKANSSSGRVNSSLGRISSGFDSIVGSARGFLAIGIIAGIAGVGRAAVGAAAQMEQHQVAFETMIGSAGRANRTLQQIREFANSTPFQFPELVGASRQLLAFGIEAENIQGTLRTLGDIAAGTSQPIGELSYLYGQIATVGKAYSMDLMQFANRGIPIYSSLAQVMGVAENQVKDLASQGRIGFREIQQAFQTMTGEGGRFNNMMERQSRTLLGLWSTFKDKVGDVALQMGQQMVPGLKDMLDAMLDLVEDGGVFIDFLKVIGRSLGALFSTIALVVRGIQYLSNSINRSGLRSEIEEYEQLLSRMGNQTEIRHTLADPTGMGQGETVTYNRSDIEQRLRMLRTRFNEANESGEALSGNISSIWRNLSGASEEANTLSNNVTTARNRTQNGTGNNQGGSGSNSQARIDNEIERFQKRVASEGIWAVYFDMLSEQITGYVTQFENVFNKLSSVAKTFSSQISSIFKMRNDTDLKNLESRYNKELQLLEEQKNKQLELAGFGEDEETDLSRTEKEIEELKNKLAIENDLKAQASLEDQIREKEKEQKKYQILSDYEKRKEALEAERDRQKRKLERDAAKRQKNTAIYETIVNTISASIAVFKSLASIPIVGWALGIAASTATIALGMAQVAEIRRQPLPQLAKGGYADKATTAIFGEAGPEAVMPLNDSVFSRLAKGVVMHMERLFQSGNKTIPKGYQGFGYNSNQSTTIHTHVNLDGKMVAEVVDEYREEFASNRGASNYATEGAY